MAKRTGVGALGLLLVGGVLAACGTKDPTSATSATPAASPGAGATGAAPSDARVVSRDAALGLPTFVWAQRSPLTAAAAKTLGPDAAARAHLRRHAPLYRMAPADVDGLELRELHDTSRGAVIARFGRRVDGVEVFGEQIAVTMDRGLDAVALSGYVTADVPAVAKQARAAKTAPAFPLSAERAIAFAVADLGGLLDPAELAAPTPAGGDYQAVWLKSGAAQPGAPVAPVRFKRVYHRDGAGALVPAYYAEVDQGELLGRPRVFSTVISAIDGKVLLRNDLVADASPYTYRVWAGADATGLPMPFDGPQGTDPTPHPTGVFTDPFDPAYLPQNDLAVTSLIGASDPWLPTGATQTVGNNVDAFANLSNPDGFTPGTNDFRAAVTAPGEFLYAYDPLVSAQQSTTQQAAGVVQLFFNINFLHDWYYVSGFNERSGNAQYSNYGRGGLENDPILGQAQDVAGFDNANMSTPADGARPRMRMYVWDTSAYVTVTTPPSIAGSFTHVGTAVGWGPTAFDTGQLQVVRPTPVDACTALTGTYTGLIVLADRGTCGFSIKAQMAFDAGAAGIIIANVSSSGSPTVAPGMTATTGFTPNIPALSMNLANGDTLRARLAAGDTVTAAMHRDTFVRDGSLDNQIVAHEWGHYISNRLIYNANGLTTNMARGLGEGWADFHAMLLTVRAEDILVPANSDWSGVYALASWAVGKNASVNGDHPYWFGIRRVPYSTDMTKDPLTFKHIADANPIVTTAPFNPNSGPNSEVHNTGEVWTTMLWECYAALLRDATHDTSGRGRTFAQVRDLMKDYLVAAYKATPADPTLIEARNALFAVMMAGDPVDFRYCASAFAKRGAGVYAASPDRYVANNNGVVESFVDGAALSVSGTVTDDVTPVCNGDGVLDSNETGTLTLTFRNVGFDASPAVTVALSSTTSGISFPGGATVDVPALAIGEAAVATVAIQAGTLADIATYTVVVDTPDVGTGAKTDTLRFLGNYDVALAQATSDGFESPRLAWFVTSSPSLPAASSWSRATAAADAHYMHGPDVGQPATSDLVTPPMQVGAGQSLTVSFKHRYAFEVGGSTSFDGGVIEITADNGQTWTDVGPGAAGYTGTLFTGSGNPLAGRPAYTGVSASYPTFNTRTLNLGTAYAGKVVFLRFRIGSDAATANIGWDIDDVVVTGLANTPFSALVPQRTTCDNAPDAQAGISQTVGEWGPAPTYAPVTVTLDGSASFDVDGDALTYTWTQIQGPAVTLSSDTAQRPTFTAPQVPATPSATVVGFQLLVSDGTLKSAPSYTFVTVQNVNRPPVANAGPAQTVVERTTVTLDGSASADPDSDNVLTYTWTAPAGITLSSLTAPKPTFVAPDVTADTPYTFSLRVSDGSLSSTATVVITVTNLNRPPVASAGTAQTVDERTTVTLSGSAVDPDGDTPLTFAWTAPGGITLSDATAALPTFDAPEVTSDTTFTFSLVATDPAGASSAPASVNVLVRNVNRAPLVSAGAAQTVDERTTVTLAGSASDPDGDTLALTWTPPAGIGLSDIHAATPTFTAPEVTADTDYTFTLAAVDPTGAAASASVTVRVRQVDRAPVASAGNPQTVPEATKVTLYGSASDPDGDTPLSYTWTAPAGISLSSLTAASPTFTAPLVNADTTYTFSLVVTDPAGAASAPATVTVTVKNVVHVPIAIPGPSVSTQSGVYVTLDGSGSSDPDGLALTYQWTQVSGPPASIQGADTAKPRVTAPTVTTGSAVVTIELVVSNGKVSSAPATVALFVTPLDRPATDGGGCGCSVGAERKTGAPSPLLALAGLPLVVLVRRKRRRR